MIRLVALLLCFLLVFYGAPPVQADISPEDQYILNNCENYIIQNQSDSLTSDHYYNYETYVDSFSNGSPGSVALDQLTVMSDMLLDVSYEPGTDDYIEALSNMIALSDADSVYDNAEQTRLDNLMTGADYLLDAKDILCDSLAVVPSKYLNVDQQAIVEAIDNLNNVCGNAEDAIAMISNLEVALESYSNYDQFLAGIEENSSGELKEAAQIMRQSLGELTSYMLDSYSKWTAESAGTVASSVFDVIEPTVLEDLKDILPIDFLSQMSDIWQLEKDASLLAGNLLFGLENAADRTREMVALSQISDAMDKQLAQQEEAFLKAMGNGSATPEMVCQYMNTLNYYRSNRSRGEYCLYSLLTEDAQLLSALYDRTTTDEWYQSLLYFLYKNELRTDAITADPSETEMNVYLVFNGVADSYQEAAAFCESIGGHLATISSAAENQYLYSVITNSGYDSAYFGLYEASKDNWVWVTGEPVTFTFWGGREPNNEGGDEDYAMFYYKYSNGSWNDGDFGGSTAGKHRTFICEWESEEAFVEYWYQTHEAEKSHPVP